MKKKVIIVVVIIVLMILLVPIPFKLRDGGTVEWKSLTYSIANVHSIYAVGNESNKYELGYKEGIVIKIFNMTVYNNTKYSLKLISGHFFKKQKIDILPAYFFIFLISYSCLFILILKKSIPSYIILLSKKLTKEECFYEILLQSRKNCK